MIGPGDWTFANHLCEGRRSSYGGHFYKYSRTEDVLCGRRCVAHRAVQRRRAWVCPQGVVVGHLSDEEFALRGGHAGSAARRLQTYAADYPDLLGFAGLVVCQKAQPLAADNLVIMDLELDVHAKLQALVEKH